MKFKNKLTIFISLLALAAAAACQASPTATPTPIPTEVPTEIPTDIPSPTDTPAPTQVPATPTAAQPTATPLPPIATTKIITNVRAGPGAGFPLIGKLKKGEVKPIIGKSEDSMWWQVAYQDKFGWIAADFTDVQGGTNGVPVVVVAALPTPTILPTRIALGKPATRTLTPTASAPPPAGRIYFVVAQSDGVYTTAWLRPDKLDQIFPDVTLGNSPGDFNESLSTNGSPLDWSEQAGKLAYVTGTGSQNKLDTVDENQNVLTFASHGAIATPRWFSDGAHLAYVGYDNNFQNQKIYIANADGSAPRVCFPARSGEALRGLAVSPTTSDIVFASNMTGRYELWKIDSSCSAPAQLTHDNADVSAPAYSPDGTKIVFSSNKSGGTDYNVYIMNADGSNEKQLDVGFAPVFSPDGKWIAYTRNGEVYIMDTDGGNIKTIAPGYRPAWAP